MAVFTGDDFDNELAGGADPDVLTGLGGADTLTGGAGDDVLYGFEGSTGLDPAARDGADLLDGGEGNDLLRGNSGNDTLLGGAGTDNLRGDAGNDLIDGGDGIDVVSYRFDEVALGAGVFFDASAIGSAFEIEFSDGLGGMDTLRGVENVVLGGSSFNDTLVGGLGNDQVSGNAGNDVLGGRAGGDALEGGIGDDILYGFVASSGLDPSGLDGADLLDGGEGNDILRGNSGNDTLLGGAGTDNLRGDAGSDLIDGGDGIDSVSFRFDEAGLTAGVTFNASTIGTAAEILIADGLGGTDTLRSIEGVLLTGTQFNDRFTGSGGNDQLDGAGGRDTLIGGAGDDRLISGGGGDAMSGGTGQDSAFYDFRVVGDGSVHFTAAAINPSATSLITVVGVGSDTVSGIEFVEVFGAASADTLIGSTGDDSLDGGGSGDLLAGLGGADTLIGGAGDDLLFGWEDNSGLSPSGVDGADLIDGGEGDDVLRGNAANDTLLGGAGIDNLRGDAGDDLIDGGEGFDQAAYRFDELGQTSGIVFSAASIGTADEIQFADGQGGTDTLRSIEGAILTGTGFNDSLTGSENRDQISGADGNDTLVGAGGDDVLIGGPGLDDLRGGAGHDIALYDFALGPQVAVFFNAAGLDPASSSQILIGGAVAANAIGVEAVDVSGTSASDTLVGSGGGDGLAGVAGDDILVGLGGADTLFGGEGSDLLFGLIDNSGIDAGGVDGADSLDGGAGDDILRGNAGNDTLLGGAGTDNLRGDAGNDLIDGGEGFDQAAYRFDELGLSSGIVLSAASFGTADEIQFADGQGGIDTLRNIEGAILTGTAFGDRFTGSGSSDQISGEGGNDTLIGGAGDDVLIGGDGGDDLRGGTGHDIAVYDFRSGFVGSVLFSAAALDPATSVQITIGGVGSDTATGVEAVQVDGSANNDRLTASRGNDSLAGWNGNDVLAGLAGADTLRGGDGNDLLYGFETSSGLDPAAADGADLIDAGAGDDLLRGNSGNDTLLGGDGNDNLRGDAGSDFVDGGAGIDVMSFRFDEVGLASGVVFDGSAIGTAGSVVIADGLGGMDTLGGIENVLIAGTAHADVLTGAGADDQLSGNGGNDTLRGGTGADVLQGGAGNDLIEGGSGRDIGWYDFELDAASGPVTFSAATLSATVDTVLADGLGGQDTLRGIEAVRVSGAAAADSFTGSNGADELSGRAGDDSLSGGAGADTLAGGTGNDTLRGGNGDDLYEYLGPDGTPATAYGFDTIVNADATGSGIDVLRLVDVSQTLFADLDIEGSDLLMNLYDGNLDDPVEPALVGAVTVVGFFGSNLGARIDRIEFADGRIDFSGNASTIVGQVFAGDALDETVIWGVGGNDQLTGTSADESFRPGAGNDTVVGNGGHDKVSYEDDDPNGITVDLRLASGQVIDASGGVDTLIDIDEIVGSNQADLMIGSAGNDHLEGDPGDDTVEGGGGTDILSGNGGFDTVSYANAGAGVTVNLTDGTARGGDGNDLLFAFEAVTGSRYGDALTGNAYGNLLSGGGGADTLDGSAGSDTMRGGNGNDNYRVNAAGDVIVETADGGTDLVRSSATRTLGAHQENLTLIGTATVNGTGNNLANRIAGNNAANSLNGAGGHDQLLGQGGNDTLNGAVGNDTLSGGAGADVFRFTAALNATTNVDTLADFDAAADRIELGSAAFAGIGPAGGLAAGSFALGSAALDANDRVLYDAASGELRYDADGSGAGAAVLFAMLTPGTSLTAGDFFVI